MKSGKGDVLELLSAPTRATGSLKIRLSIRGTHTHLSANTAPLTYIHRRRRVANLAAQLVSFEEAARLRNYLDLGTDLSANQPLSPCSRWVCKLP